MKVITQQYIKLNTGAKEILSGLKLEKNAYIFFNLLFYRRRLLNEVKHRICIVYGLYHLRCGGRFVGATLTIYAKLLCPHVQENELNWLLRFFMYSSYVVISVLNAFKVAIAVRSIQYLRLTGDAEKDEQKSCLCL